VSLEILPLAITMMAGPQIMSAILLLTSPRPVRGSVAFLLGVGLAATVGTAITTTLVGLLGQQVDLGEEGAGSLGTLIQIVLVGLLVLAALRTYLGRATSEPPAWLGTLTTASTKRAFSIGFLLILVMPSDLVVMFTVGTNLAQNNLPISAAVPFLATTVLIAALPLLSYVLFRRRAERAMPVVRDWMNTHSWVLTVGVCVLFVFLII
jgi:hypothetical protein